MTSINIRPVTHDDVAQMAVLHRDCFDDACWNCDQLAGSLSLSTTQGFCAVQDSHLVGFILCQVLDVESEVLTFCVAPSFQKNGIGCALMHAFQQTLKAGTLFLEVAQNNAPAQNLYKKCGFYETGRRANYYTHGQMAVDAVFYLWSHPETIA